MNKPSKKDEHKKHTVRFHLKKGIYLYIMSRGPKFGSPDQTLKKTEMSN